MPRSRNRRKKAKNKRAKSSVSKRPKKDAEKIAEPASAEKKEGAKPRVSFFEMLYSEKADGLFRFVTFSPLFFGAWLAGGVLLNLPFVALTLGVILAYYTQGFRKRDDIIFVKDLCNLFYLAQAGCVGAFYYLTDAPIGSILFALMLCISFLETRLDLNKAFGVCCASFVIVFRMSVFALLGVLSLFFIESGDIVIEFGVLGLVPGSILAAAFIANNSSVLLDAGWKRSREVMHKKQGKILRPGRLTVMYSLFLVIGPAVPVSVAPLGIFPSSFLACTLAFLAVPKLADSFLRAKSDDALIAVHTANLAAVMSLVTFLAGLVAKYFL